LVDIYLFIEISSIKNEVLGGHVCQWPGVTNVIDEQTQ